MAFKAREVSYGESALDVRLNWAMKNVILASASFG
jgi:hypothetical protein